MAKLTEMTGWELMTALAEIAEPVGNLVTDDAVWDCFVKCTRKGVRLRQQDGLRFLLTAYADLMPKLFGNEHRADMAKILSIVEGRSVEATMKMPGKQLFEDFVAAYKETLEPFFTKAALSARKG